MIETFWLSDHITGLVSWTALPEEDEAGRHFNNIPRHLTYTFQSSRRREKVSSEELGIQRGWAASPGAGVDSAWKCRSAVRVLVWITCLEIHPFPHDRHLPDVLLLMLEMDMHQQQVH